MSYLSLYRKWRPYRLEDVVGQEAVVTILSHSLQEQKIAHAYLFSGPRGVGKTTTARILAMAVNCAQGIVPHPCGQCESCLSIRQGNSLDVLEIDAASHRGIDEIRELREKVKYSSLESRFKVYIIDEAHMLTNEAFNALLKTLEEPPQHVIFILATTDIHRIPETIISRCVRLSFNPIAPQVIVEQLQKMVQEEEIEIEESVFHLIARKSEGSLRDAEVFLEQLLAWGEPKIDLALASSILRELDEEELSQFFQTIREGNRREIFLSIERWIERGLSPEDVIRNILRFFRDLLLVSVLKDYPTRDIPKERRLKLQNLVASTNPDLLRKALEELQNVEMFSRRSLQPRIVLEIGSLKLVDILHVPPQKVSSETLSTKVSMTSATSNQEKNFEKAPYDDFWGGVLEEVKKAKISLYAFLQAAEVKRTNASRVELWFAPPCQFHKESIERRENMLLLQDILQKVAGKSCEVACILTEQNTKEAPPVFPKPEGVGNSKKNLKDDKSILLEITDLFSGIVVNYSVSEETKGGWESAELEKSDEGSPEDAGENG
ncbi:MAG: DNA polymerase III subunit gamma/tau [Candidatus Caldatribacteriaceae bacterium]